ncbi:2368_t:CDS:2, partial [Acaulospora morrowiae]
TAKDVAPYKMTKTKKTIDINNKEYQIVSEITTSITNSFDEKDTIEITTNTQEVFEEWNLEEFEEVEKRFLNWHNNAGSNLRTIYTGTSRTTLWRKDKEKKKHEEHVKEIKTINMFFQPVQTILSTQHSRLSLLHIRLEELNQQCSIGKSMKENNKIFTYDYLRLLSIRQFIQLLLDGQSKMNISRQIAQTIWCKGDYMAMCIRKWGSHFIQTGTLQTHYQGKYTKLKSLLDDEDFTENCKAWLQQQKPEVRSPKNLKTYIEDTLFPKSTEPQLKPGKKEFVQVTHDECHFYPNDSQRRVWIQEEENILRSKHLGRSIMVSAFLCPCHGLLRLSEQQLQANSHIEHQESFVLRSIQEDGYWKSEHMLDQV